MSFHVSTRSHRASPNIAKSPRRIPVIRQYNLSSLAAGRSGSPLIDLPPELLLKIFGYLCLDDLLSIIHTVGSAFCFPFEDICVRFPTLITCSLLAEIGLAYNRHVATVRTMMYQTRKL
ncbi:F-box protein [Aspergillus lucknowensis]|uniref:F-box domain-containing protein n=1 Tax=Aspergillus lucknowensis TaxID=176173 RepID=A0ABR4L3L5_9EURO